MAGYPTALQIKAASSLAYSVTYQATGLPAGLSINSSGRICGTPTVAGHFPVTVTATDSHGIHGSATFTWTIVRL